MGVPDHTTKAWEQVLTSALPCAANEEQLLSMAIHPAVSSQTSHLLLLHVSQTVWPHLQAPIRCRRISLLQIQHMYSPSTSFNFMLRSFFRVSLCLLPGQKTVLAYCPTWSTWIGAFYRLQKAFLTSQLLRALSQQMPMGFTSFWDVVVSTGLGALSPLACSPLPVTWVKLSQRQNASSLATSFSISFSLAAISFLFSNFSTSTCCSAIIFFCLTRYQTTHDLQKRCPQSHAVGSMRVLLQMVHIQNFFIESWPMRDQFVPYTPFSFCLQRQVKTDEEVQFLECLLI